VTYQLRIERRAQKALAKISQPHQDRIVEAIRALADDPRPPGAKKLSGRNGWRLRVGVYRVIYEIQDNELVVLVVSIGHRREIYRS
jgi:mRNA interferase RelE/StbE